MAWEFWIGFDPRPREGATHPQGRVFAGARVSIHAPARGRPSTSATNAAGSAFRSTPPRGGDRAALNTFYVLEQKGFRSTPPRGGDNDCSLWSSRYDGFDPRPREGATFVSPLNFGAAWFRSTPPRGGDSRLKRHLYSRVGFDPRPREGATTGAAAGLAATWFRSTPPRGGDATLAWVARYNNSFDPRPREGATRPATAAEVSLAVSIHAPARGRLVWRNNLFC